MQALLHSITNYFPALAANSEEDSSVDSGDESGNDSVAGILSLDEGPYAKALNEGYHMVAMKAIREHRNASQVKNNRKELLWKQYIMMMATMSRPLLEVIAHGNLQLEKKSRREIQEVLTYVSRRNSKQPSIYMLELVDRRSKLAPTANELVTILAKAEEYVDCVDHEEAYRIHVWRNPSASRHDARKGIRQYMAGTTQKNKFRALKMAMEQIWQGWTPVQMDEPLSQPLREVGYSEDGKDRLEQHYKHRSSNYLMNLFEAVCHHLQRDLGHEYIMHGEVIYLMWEEPQCMLAEELFTAVARAATRTGRGFCHADAGDSAGKLYNDKGKFNWPAIQQDVLTTSPYMANIKAENQRIADFLAGSRNMKNLFLEVQALQKISDQMDAGVEEPVDKSDQAEDMIAKLKKEIAALKIMSRLLDPPAD